MMLEAPQTHALGFQVLQQEKRQQSVNLSIISSANYHFGSYQQLLKHFKEMTSEKIDMKQLHQSPHLRLKKYKEAVYYGEYFQGHRAGKGIMVYHNGQKYQGDWKADKRHGQGFELFANGSNYEGQYRQNKMEGQGKYLWPGGQFYEGEFLDNYKHGTGMWSDAEGNCYLGEWNQGMATGYGVYTEENGSRYEGSFEHFVKSGKGTQKFVSGDLYQGQYKNGKFNGYGQYFWSKGSSYKGNFKNGLRDGHGLWRKGDKDDKYQGEFKENKKEGYGIYTWSCGDIYKGHYHANLRHGSGQMYWADGSFYKGEWLIDKPNGKGELFDGYKRISGVFQDGILLDDDTDQAEYPRLSQFYTEGVKDHRRLIETPIRKITEQQFQNFPKGKKLVYSQVDTEEEARQIKMPKINKRANPLTKESFLTKNQLQTIAKEKARQIGQEGPHLKKKSYDARQSRQKVLHSSFQIHRMHNKKQVKMNMPSIKGQTTVDSAQKFQFFKENNPRKTRYLSRLQ